MKLFKLKSSEVSLLFLNGALDPLTHMFVDLKISKLKRVFNQVIVDAYSSPLLSMSLFARFLRKSWLSIPITPFVSKTRGVKVPISTSKTLYWYFLFFSISCSVKMVRVFLFWLLQEFTCVTVRQKCSYSSCSENSSLDVWPCIGACVRRPQIKMLIVKWNQAWLCFNVTSYLSK